jgi:AcrR family transcriptional regulator
MKAKPTRTDRRMVRNRKALLNAAEKLIAERGLERATIDEITETADLAKGTFYNHFKDKNEIAKELALTIRRDFDAEVGVAQTGIEDPAERLAAGICVFLRKAATAPTHAAVVAHMYGQWLRPEAAGNRKLRRDLEYGYRVGRFSTNEPGVALVMTVGVVQAGMMHALELADWNAVEKLALALSGLVLRALGVKWKEVQTISTKAVARVFDRDFERVGRKGL